jgi:hypothetical protein
MFFSEVVRPSGTELKEIQQKVQLNGKKEVG